MEETAPEQMQMSMADAMSAFRTAENLPCITEDFDINEELMKWAFDEPVLCTSNNDVLSNVPASPPEQTVASSQPSCSSQTGIQSKFQINTDFIPRVQMEDHDDELSALGVNVYDQSQFEAEIMGQVDRAIRIEEEKRRQEEVAKELKSVSDDIKCTKERLDHLEKVLDPKEGRLTTPSSVMNMRKEQQNKLQQLKKLEAKQKTLTACVTGSKDELEGATEENDIDDGTRYHVQQAFAADETEEERLIRTGQMTPFGTVLPGPSQPREKPKPRKIIISENQLTDFDKFLLHQSPSSMVKKTKKLPPKGPSPQKSDKAGPSSSKNTAKSSGTQELKPVKHPPMAVTLLPPPPPVPAAKKGKKKLKLGSKYATGTEKKGCYKPDIIESEISDFENGEHDDGDDLNYSDEEYLPDEKLDDTDEDGPFDADSTTGKRGQKRKLKGQDESESKSPKKTSKKVIDDGCHKAYVKRIKEYERWKLQEKHRKIMESEDGIVDSDDDEDCVEFDDFKVPSSLWNKLYRYQQTGVRWLWELHQQNCGGIMGDEMGLGKTIQIIVFLVGLKVSNIRTTGDSFQGLGPVVLVCPTTVMHQWVREFHKWWPPLRVAILHESGSYSGKKEDLVDVINSRNGILVTSYNGLVQHQLILLKHDWHYVILDEGHKIRNPDAQATLVAKQFRTAHRIILSGSPIQNNLKELWSLFDFVFPGKLGTLPVFMQQFSVPIVLGGYSNASQVQVQTAYKCATVLRDTIKPYLLRRMKADVKTSIQLPNKSEQVLFCKLTDEQIELYKAYLASPQIESIINARLQIFVGLINLRKICNHPDLYTGGPKVFKDTDMSTLTEDMHYGYYKRSGKMIVVRSLLRLWHKQGHRVLLFTQSRQMMDILERFVKRCEYSYMKMDGSTPISSRQPAIAKFNSDPNIFVFLLTTRVGGLGVNLTAANRVIIYDPDWNPSTDAQARERSWRIGQDKQVTIYRLLTAGTIEEKIYHRQIFKQFVTNRVLKDPRQRRFFKSNDLYELFTYTDAGGQGTETSAIFAGTGSEVKLVKKQKLVRPKHRKSRKDSSSSDAKPEDISVKFSSEKIEKMKEMARQISMKLLQGSVSASSKQEKPTDAEKKERDEKENAVFEADAIAPREADPDEKEADKMLSNNSDYKEIRKKSKRKKRTPVVEGKEIDHVIKKDTYRPPAESEQEKKPSNADDYVLSKLLKKSGVHTALKHDVIVDSSNPDYLLVEGEANRVAQDAIKALKQSRRQCSRAVEGIPTWTGANGTIRARFGVKKKLPAVLKNSPSDSSENKSSGEPSPSTSGITPKKPADAASQSVFNGSVSSTNASGPATSSELLAAIKKRKEACGREVNNGDSNNSSDEDNGQTPAVRRSTEHDELLDDIRNFIAFRAVTDGQATTEELLNEFRGRLPKEQTAVFKALLSRICDFHRTSSGEGIWHLKEEFR